MQNDQQKTALLVMDMQAGIVGMLSNATPLVTNVAKAIEAARQKHIRVIYVVVGFRTGAPEISNLNKGFSALRDRWTKNKPEELMKINPPIAPQSDEVVVTNRRVSAFTGSDLEVVLRAQGIQHLVLTGISTSGVVLSTTREAADKDYQITILSDGCADMDEEVHRVLTTKVFPRQAEVITVGQWINGQF